MFECRIAYLHTNGEPEGFKATGFSRMAAKEDALSQIEKKLAILRGTSAEPLILDPDRLIKRFGLMNLNKQQMETIIEDWNSGCRY